ncbi:MAG: hypothetical protein HY460_01005 [Parcubacteria group bacterium]|nr:hypothetical protein [Parcubacteria group bacterium]
MERERESTSGERLGSFILSRIKPGELTIEGEPQAFREIIESEKFREVAPTLLKEFAVSGIYNRKEKILQNTTDLDGKLSLGLLELAGFDTSQTKYIFPGETALGMFNIDTGGCHGIHVEGDIFRDRLEDITAWCDNHGEESRRGSTSAEFLYQALAELKLLEKNKTLDRMIAFNKKVESADFDWQREYSRSSETVIGLCRYMNVKQLFDFFSKGRKETDALTKEDIERYSSDAYLSPSARAAKDAGEPYMTLGDYQKRERGLIRKARRTLDTLKKDGFFLQTRLGGVIVNPNGILGQGFAAAYAGGAEGIISWSPETEGFAVSLRKKDLDIRLPEGVTVRKHIHIKSAWDGRRLSLSLGEILTALGFRGEPSVKLRELVKKDVQDGRGMFRTTPKRQDKGYVAFINGVFSVFPRGWRPPREGMECTVRVAAVKQDKNGKNIYLLDPKPRRITRL